MFRWLWKPVPNLLLTITVVVEEDGDGYHAYCPALKGLHVDGNTCDEALENAISGVFVYLRSLARHEDPLPIGPDLTVEHQYPEVSSTAFLKNVTFQWPSLQMSGIS